MSESGDRPNGPGHEDPTLGAFDAARDPWARPPDDENADERVKLTKDEPAPAQPPPPAYEPPMYEPPTYAAPGAEPPTYIPPDYVPPTYPQQSSEQPTYTPPPYPGSGPAAGYAQPYQQPGYPPADPYQQYGAPAYGQQPYGYGAQPGYPGAGYGYGAVTAGKATAVMSLGIASLVTVWCYGIGVIPAIVGLAMSGSAKREIESSGGRLTGLGMVTAGRVTSWITVGLTVIFAGLLAVVLILAAANDPTYTGN